MALKISFSKTLAPKSDTVIVTVYAQNRLSGPAARLDKETGGLIAHHLEKQKLFTGKAGQTLVLTAPKASAYTRIVLLGLGDAAKITPQDAEATGGKCYPTLAAAGAEKAALLVDNDKALKKTDGGALAAHLAAGLALRAYKFDNYKSRKPEDERMKAVLGTLTVSGDGHARAKQLFDRLEKAVQGVFLARDLINEPPNVLYPDSYARRIRDELKPLGVSVEIIDERKMQKLGFHAHLAVGVGALHGPRVVVLRWNGLTADKAASAAKGKGRAAKSSASKSVKDAAGGPVALVGKGITFDTGGNNLKPTGSIEDMKMDMAGSAAVVGVMKTLALRKAKADVVGIVGLAENSLSDRAYRPGDIISSMAGTSIEVMNTDAEGRLVLADALTYVQRTYKPCAIIDLATLTGAMMVALGYEYCGTFVNDDTLWNRLDSAGKAASEKLWRMPLDEAFRKSMDSPMADMSNLSSMGRYAGACTAAGFLERFIENDCPWAHLDIAGVAYINSDKPTSPKKAVGFGVRTLDIFVADHYESGA